MSRRNAQVVTGARGPEQVRQAESDPDAKQKSLAAQAKEESKRAFDGLVVFQAKALNHRVQLTAPASIFNPATGRVEEQRPKAAQFSGGVYRVKADAPIDEKNPELGTIVEVLQRNKNYGVGRDFWRVEDMTEYRRTQETEEFVKKLAADEELRKRVFGRLAPQVQGFAPPAEEKPTDTSDPTLE